MPHAAPPAPSAPPGPEIPHDAAPAAPLARYLAARRAELDRDYRADCLAIARDIHSLLRAEGRAPVLTTLTRQEAVGGSVLHGPLTPLRYGGRVTWTRHYVCCCDGMAYDPLLPAPVSVRGYPRAVFGLDLPMTPVTSPRTVPDLSPSRRFDDLRSAGRALAEELAPAYTGRADTVVLALVRGGVKVALEVAARLRLPLDVVILRRLLLPNGPGAPLCVFNVAGTRVMDDGLWREPASPPAPLDHFLADAFTEFAGREALCRAGREPLDVAGRTVLLVDNGTRTGGTVRAAIRALRTRNPARIVAALPIGTVESREGLEAAADEVVCLSWETFLPNVAAGYRRYDIPRMEEVGPLMAEAWSPTDR